jgi:hypothetical protein
MPLPARQRPVTVAGPMLGEGIDRALKLHGKFFLEADLTIPISKRMISRNVIDMGNFGVRSRSHPAENRAITGMFTLHTVKEDCQSRDILREINPMRRKKIRPVAATTHELVDFAQFFVECSDAQVGVFGGDEFTFVEGEDLPRISIMRWSEESMTPALFSETSVSVRWKKGDSILLWG